MRFFYRCPEQCGFQDVPADTGRLYGGAPVLGVMVKEKPLMMQYLNLKVFANLNISLPCVSYERI